MRGKICRTEGAAAVAWADIGVKVRETESGPPVHEVLATLAAEAYLRAIIEVPAHGEECVDLGPPGTALLCLVVSARTEGLMASFDGEAWFGIAQPLLLSGDVTAAFGIATPAAIRLRNETEFDGTVDLVLLHARA
jgi:hypothetical protein